MLGPIHEFLLLAVLCYNIIIIQPRKEKKYLILNKNNGVITKSENIKTRSQYMNAKDGQITEEQVP